MTVTIFRENLRIALHTIKTNKVRTFLTISIIAFGIMALVGIMTSIDSIKKSITNEFTMMGANTFNIESRSMRVQIGNQKYRTKNYGYISYRQAEEFKQRFHFPAEVSIWTYASGMGTVKYGKEKTNPNIPVIGVDENYTSTSGYEIDKGRNFTSQEITDYRNYAIIGAGLAKKLFPSYEDPINRIITVGNGRFKVIGVLVKKGSGFGVNSDNLCLLPYTTVRQYFSRPRMGYTISVKAASNDLIDAAVGQAEGVFRIVRNLDARDESDFNITKSDMLVNMLLENLKKINWAAIVIGIITLLGAVVGLMNIMLVSVTERTREIGIRKAMGAKNDNIKQQFLYEAIVIGQLGGAFGIVLGIIIGNVVSLLINTSSVIPWAWVFIGVGLCLIVGVISGYFPAVKAARQDPIVALRYE
ncbi:MAG TPA: ABC transporter permease [Bacteroidales bacterium]|nr:ABC transporter permease [Bacteroidales bacterium]